MRPRCRPGDREVAEIADRQYGVVSHRQLLELGFGRSAIQRRLSGGRLHPIHTGVYSVGHSRLSGRGRCIAAVLACGPGAVVSHRRAADLHGILRTASARIDITVPGRSRRGQPGIVLHLVRHLHLDDCSQDGGIPVTSISRTLLDLAATLPRHAKLAFEEADRRGLLDAGDVGRLLARSRGRAGVPVLAAFLADYGGPPPLVRSKLERRFFDLCRDAGLPLPSVNVLINGMEVDMAWLDRRLVVELDSRSFHATRAAFEEDRIRDASLQISGYRVIRITHRRLDAAPAEVLGVVRRLLVR